MSEHTKGELMVLASDDKHNWGLDLVDNKSNRVAQIRTAEWLINPEQAFANAYRLIKCWNCHDELMIACEKIHRAIGGGDAIEIANVCGEYVIPALVNARVKL